MGVREWLESREWVKRLRAAEQAGFDASWKQWWEEKPSQGDREINASHEDGSDPGWDLDDFGAFVSKLQAVDARRFCNDSPPAACDREWPSDPPSIQDKLNEHAALYPHRERLIYSSDRDMTPTQVAAVAAIFDGWKAELEATQEKEQDHEHRCDR